MTGDKGRQKMVDRHKRFLTAIKRDLIAGQGLQPMSIKIHPKMHVQEFAVIQCITLFLVD